MPPENNLILTGIPRSGTSLICSLLNQIDDVLALVEPIDMGAFLLCKTPSAREAFLNDYFQVSRSSVITTRKVVGLDLEVETNTFSECVATGRKNTIRGIKEQYLDRSFSEDFTFIVKHPNAFTALLEELSQRWVCYAIVRNPVAVIASWNTLAHPLSNGHAPMAEVFHQPLKKKLALIDDQLERQIHLMNWYFEQYSQYLSRNKIIYYESVIDNASLALSAIIPNITRTYDQGVSMNNSRLYDRRVMTDIALRLVDLGGAWTGFYSANDVLGLASGV